MNKGEKEWRKEWLAKQAALDARMTIRIGGDGTLVLTQQFAVTGGTWWLQKFARENRAESRLAKEFAVNEPALVRLGANGKLVVTKKFDGDPGDSKPAPNRETRAAITPTAERGIDGEEVCGVVVCEPLLAVADLAGSKWGAAARAALLELFGAAGAEDSSVSARLLADIRTAFDTAAVDRFASKDLVAALVADENSPWPEFNRGKEISPTILARLLRRFDIASRTIRGKGNTFKGYLRDSFEDAWTRYLGSNSSTPAVQAVTPSQAANALNETQFSETSHIPSVTVQESAPEPLFKGDVTAVTVAASLQAPHTPKVLVTGEL